MATITQDNISVIEPEILSESLMMGLQGQVIKVDHYLGHILR